MIKPLNITNSVGYKMARIIKLKRRSMDIHMKELNLSRTQWQVLLGVRILVKCSQKELLKHVDIDPGHLARVLDCLEKAGYIVRNPIAEDRRCLRIEMTEFAEKELVSHIDATIKKENVLLMHGISDSEKEILEKILDKIDKNLVIALGNEFEKEDLEAQSE